MHFVLPGKSVIPKFILTGFFHCFMFSSVPVVSPSDPVILAAKKMREHRVNSVVVMTGNMLLGIFTYVFFLEKESFMLLIIQC